MTHVRAHERKKPSRPPEYISKHEQLRAELAKANADEVVNQFRQDIGYRPAANALTVIIGALRVLSVKAKELVN